MKRSVAALMGLVVVCTSADHGLADQSIFDHELRFVWHSPVDGLLWAASIPVYVQDEPGNVTTLVIDDPLYSRTGDRWSTALGTRHDTKAVVSFEITATLERPWHPVCDLQTTATFAFLGTDVEGNVYRRPMLDATEQLAGLGELLVPIVFEYGCYLWPMHVAIDLTQWSANPPSHSVGDWIDLSDDGTSPQLPGFLFSEEPLTFDPRQGYLTKTPFTEGVQVDGFYGVQVEVIPDPATAVLLALGGLPVLLRRRAA